jgi:hydrogenase expression/formation protein HypC
VCLGLPGEVVALEEQHGLRFARVRFGGITHAVCLEYQPTAQVGDYVLVHVGFAIAILDQEAALRAWEVLTDLGEAPEGEGP